MSLGQSGVGFGGGGVVVLACGLAAGLNLVGCPGGSKKGATGITNNAGRGGKKKIATDGVLQLTLMGLEKNGIRGDPVGL